MKQVFILLLALFAVVGFSQELQLDLGVTMGSGAMKYRYLDGVRSIPITEKENPKIKTLDFYLSAVTQVSDKWYFRSTLASLNYSNEIKVSYGRSCVTCPSGLDTFTYFNPISRHQIALDLLGEYRLLDKTRANAYINAGITIIKRLPTSEGALGGYTLKYTPMVNLGTTFWLSNNMGLHLSSGYRLPSFYDSLNTLELSIHKFFISIGFSLKRKKN